jgi:VanZ family protein
VSAIAGVCYRFVAAPVWGRAASLVLATGLTAWAVVDAFQPPAGSAARLGPGIPGFDKVLHAGAYGVLALVACQAVAGLARKGPKARVAAAHCVDAECPKAWLAVAGVWLYATAVSAVAELLQNVAERGRNAELADVAASSGGALAVCLLFARARAVQSGQRPPTAAGAP